MISLVSMCQLCGMFVHVVVCMRPIIPERPKLLCRTFIICCRRNEVQQRNFFLSVIDSYSVGSADRLLLLMVSRLYCSMINATVVWLLVYMCTVCMGKTQVVWFNFNFNVWIICVATICTTVHSQVYFSCQ